MSEGKNNLEDKSSVGIFPFVIAILFVLLVWVANYCLLIGNSDRGVYGDMFGAANSVFSGLAFAGVVYAIFLQRHEVQIAKQEISRTKKILKIQQDIALEQGKHQITQSFEGTFFNLLRVFTDVRSAMDLRDNQGHVTAEGSDTFDVFLKRVERKIGKNSRIDDPVAAYENLYEEISSELGHYFRTLYNLVKFVHQSQIEDKRLYSNMIRAQLSDSEADILFLNGLSERGEKFKPLIEEYALLKNVRIGRPMFLDSMKRYDKKAF